VAVVRKRTANTPTICAKSLASFGRRVTVSNPPHGPRSGELGGRSPVAASGNPLLLLHGLQNTVTGARRALCRRGGKRRLPEP